ncbi:MAG: hypothetical protein N2596_03475 [Syntrophorhabdaceae bacterium]|nr:hypothetical protein [Syntrophorhabdaceae bacterium]
MYKGFVVSKKIIGEDPHFLEGCSFCHKGDNRSIKKEDAHRDLISRPSKDIKTCESCHEGIAKKFKTSLHYTCYGLREGIIGRLSPEEVKTFDKNVFETSCRSCHASCGSCHVSSPSIAGTKLGLIDGHKFVKKDEGRTCALCHGGRVYPEFTGEYSGSADIHYQKGMVCTDCHKKDQLHGDGMLYRSMKEVKNRPKCTNCHKVGTEDTERSQAAHKIHKEKLSCYACHASGQYRNCFNCHAGKGAESKQGFYLGINPRDKKTFTTLRLIPTIRDTFKVYNIKMEKYDTLPNYWDTTPHTIKKRTDRTRSCDVCHKERRDYLTNELLIKNGSKANFDVIFKQKK